MMGSADLLPDATAPVIHVEVAYALAQQQWLLRVALPPTATLKEALVASGVLALVPGLDPNPDAYAEDVGIFSEPARLDSPLQDGDRVEIYRPLQIDPKESRRRRARSDSEKNSDGEGP